MMNTAENLPTVSVEKAGEIMEAVIAKGDLAQLGPHDRARYYRTVCDSIGLNPLTKPFEYITLNGKLTLYARKETTDQLRKMYGVSVIDMNEMREEGLVIVTVKVRDASGRTDMAKGAVSLKGLQGEALANAIMKAETKAKRRATLSICGLGFLDESEVEAMPDAVPRYTKTKQAAKDLYSALQDEVHRLSTSMQAKEWMEHNAERLKLLPHDWEDFLRTSCHELIMSEEPVEVWDDDAPPAEALQDSDSKWDALGPVKQAGILCSDPQFWPFLSLAGRKIENADQAAVSVRNTCGVKSRSQLATDDLAAKKWRTLVADYRVWQRADDPSPRPTHEDAPGAGDPAGSPTPPTPGEPAAVSLEDEARAAACKGEPAFDTFWKNLEAHERKQLKPLGEELRGLMNSAHAG